MTKKYLQIVIKRTDNRRLRFRGCGIGCGTTGVPGNPRYEQCQIYEVESGGFVYRHEVYDESPSSTKTTAEFYRDADSLITAIKHRGWSFDKHAMDALTEACANNSEIDRAFYEDVPPTPPVKPQPPSDE